MGHGITGDCCREGASFLPTKLVRAAGRLGLKCGSARGADSSGRSPILLFARLTHRQLLRLVPVAKVTDHFHTDWYRNRAAVRQGLSILAGIFFVEGAGAGSGKMRNTFPTDAELPSRRLARPSVLGDILDDSDGVEETIA
jgi:hypothetical protein